MVLFIYIYIPIMNKATQRPVSRPVQKWLRKDELKRRQRKEAYEYACSEEGQAKMGRIISIMTNGYL